ncbi:MAG: hypothetical protein F6K55_49085 [Moorea sp. SIO4A3]|nr:hypothetical protein [Moorena sp. SIO4A3]
MQIALVPEGSVGVVTTMECRLCGDHQTHKPVKTSIGHQRYYCRVCRETTCTFDTLYYRATD